jgi:murein DD-endopeptidase MepM/ murein hydrolase activator NlpD
MTTPPPHRTALNSPGRQTWRWPLDPPISILRPFVPPVLPWGPGHRGLDLAALPGRPVYAAGPGQVTFAATLAGRGVIAIAHPPTGLRTTYLPVTPAVRVGQHIAGGQRIGLLQSAPAHCAPRTCLHWGLLRDDTYLNPLTLVCRPTIRLLPVWPRPRPLSTIPASPHPPALCPSTHPLTSTSPAHPGRQAPATPPASAHPTPLAPAMSLVSASDATGGAVGGLLLALLAARLWALFRHHRPTRRRRLPPGVIDLTHERARRRPHNSGQSPA